MLKDEVKKQQINNIIGNFAGHAGITYWVKHELPEIPAGGAQGFNADFLITGFMFPAIIAAIFLFWFRSKMRRGDFEQQEVANIEAGAWLPGNLWLASTVIGIIGLVSAALPLGIFLMLAEQPDALSPLAVSLSKGIWAAIAAGIIVPVSIYHGARVAAAD